MSIGTEKETHFARLARLNSLARIRLARDKAELVNTLLLSTLKSVALWAKQTGAFQDHNEDQQMRCAVDNAIAQAKEPTK